ncbi:alpha/beta hydrolase family protein [Chitinophaga sp. LS1]|uniref:alpha/beta hydrolase family protein n=1 Tax=Chitinophaga sp. LS1 TaxID=3051176 RepID=UPI002AAA9F25|nr:prolyl oligopeptidase family serine peptidase [Chitinophaga sp. LS1]WPV67848.1 prolyl oligopeptidase family serine peptidase [Chitinophaga sp. LS1]
MERGNINSDGKYVSYNIAHSSNVNGIKSQVIVQSISNKWKKTFNTATTSISFSPDGKRGYFILSNDSLAILTLGTDNISYIEGVSSFRLISDYLLYNSKTDPKKLSVVGAFDRITAVLDSIIRYEYNKKNDALILIKIGQNNKRIISYYHLKTGLNNVIWEGEEVKNLLFDYANEKIAFIGISALGEKGIWVYNSGQEKAILIFNTNEIKIDSSNEIIRIHRFSENGNKLFIVAQPKEGHDDIKKIKKDANVTIWSYTDAKLKSQYERTAKEIPQYFYAIDLIRKTIISINKKNETIIDIGNDLGLIRQFSGNGDIEDEDWNPQSQYKNLFVSLQDGTRSNLPIEYPMFSRGGHFIFYQDSLNKDYFTWNLITGNKVNITRAVTSEMGKIKNPYYKIEFTSAWDYQSYWLDDDSSVILYAERDIWQADPSGKHIPVNITNGYGAKNNIVFYPVADLSTFKFRKGEELILVGFNFSNKQNGFYRIKWGIQKDPQKIVMSDYVYYNPHVLIDNGYDNQPIKATNSNVWLIRRMNAEESPNYFVTKDFKSFSPVSDVYPEKKYNWVTSELHIWKTFNGDSCQGVLYRPENFNPNIKYPIIYYYYEEYANNLNSYLIPRTFIGPINIPYIVSQGYLVFVPDIHYKFGETGMSAYNSVVSAAEYMATKPYVDSTKMGIQGHSFGGYETNFILTKTNIFAAACSASGITDLISFSGGLTSQGKSVHWMTSKGQIRLNVKLWQDPQRYINNSPLFYLDKITTPLLMMHTTDDTAVPFGQALELFNALRQFRKKVWMLIYKGEDHVLRDKHNAYDYTVRQIQFFDHYLKGKDLPSWMAPAD